MRLPVLVVVVAALLAVANAQNFGACNGLNVTTNIRDVTIHTCPYGYYTDINQGRCLTYRQVVDNFLGMPCDVHDDCGPMAVKTTDSTQIMNCGVKKVCTWLNTRARGDSCSVNTNCASYGSTINGCSKYNNTCVVRTTVYTAQYLDRCNYQDYSETVACNPLLYFCDATNYGNCKPLLQLGEQCGGSIIVPCRGDLTCFNQTCSTLRARTESCAIDSNCAQTAGRTICFQGLCAPQRLIGESCSTSSFSQCSQDTVLTYCNPTTQTCLPYQQLNENCNGTFVCSFSNNLRCVTVQTGPTINNCLLPSQYNQTCGSGSLQNICATNMTCVRGYCMRGDLGDQCFAGSCKTAFACVDNVCESRVGAGGNCTRSANLCFDGLTCYNKTCIAPQIAGQPCDPTGNLNPLNPLFCNATLQCSRNICIFPNSLSVGSLCNKDSDCDSSYCDPFVKKCTRRKMCATSSTGCRCVCMAGFENLGQCILDNCGKYKTALANCLNDQGLTTISSSSITTLYAWLDSGSSFYTKCERQHQEYVMCQATMHKWGAPAVPLGDAINYNLAAVSASSTIATSFMVMIAVIMSALFML